MKKIILSIILVIASLSPAYASDSSDIDWINFDWESVIPDQHTIDLANMYLKIWNHMEPNTSKATINEFIASDFDSKTAHIMTEEYKKALSFFGVKHAGVAYFSENNYNSFAPKMMEWDGWHNPIWLGKHCQVTLNNICGLATDKNNFYHFIGSQNDFTLWKMYVAHHESAHAFQNSYNLSRQDRNNQHPNCWIREGQAEVLAMASSVQYFEIDFHRDHVIRSVKNVLGKISFDNKNNMIQSFKNIQSNYKLCFESHVGYSVGFLLSEYLYINFSVDQVHNLIKDLILNYSFDQALSKNMGIDENKFYSDSFDYIIKSYEKSID